MAKTNGDGSIILSTVIDNAGAKAGLNSLTKLAGKAFLAIGAAAGAATVAITKMAVSAYADYEQLVGGVETLFKDSADTVLKYANDAFRTTGHSANEYMANVTAFSASLISSLGGDTAKAAEVANQAMISMADNANKMGTPMENVQTAFQGFAKGQYMLLDNLKLGYRGTKTEMERLLKDAEAYLATQGKTAKFSINNLADVYTAIETIQKKLDISGTTRDEAEKTISGSLAMMKASWQNTLSAIAGGGDLNKAIDNLVYSISRAFDNLAPAVERSLLGIGQLVERVAPLLVQTVASSIIKSIPNLLTAIYKMIIGIAKGIYEGIKSLLFGGTQTITAQVEESASGIGVAASNMNALADATEKAGKKAKKSLAGFDDLQILTSQSAGNAEEMASASFNSSGGGGGLGDIASPALDSSKFSAMAETIKTVIADIMSAVSPALIAVGLLILMAGAILPGIGLIAAGAATYIASDVMQSDNPMGTFMEWLDILKDIAIPALFGLGVLLLFLGNIPLGVGLILAGAVAIGVNEIQSSEFDGATLETKIYGILQVVSGALIVIGVLLIFFGVIPLGLGFVIAGAVLFEISEQRLNEGGVTSSITAFIEENRGLLIGVAAVLIILAVILFCTGVGIPLALGMLVAGGALLAVSLPVDWGYIGSKIAEFMKNNKEIVLGIAFGLFLIGLVLVITGVGLPLGLGMILVGGALLVAEAKIQEDAIPNMISEFFKNNAALVVGIGIALVIIGIILLFTGVGTALGIGLIIAGGAAIGTEVALNWDFILDKIKGVWEKIKSFWNEKIAPIFTAEWWKELAKKAGNGLIAGFEGMINGVITAFESMINWIITGLNKLSFENPLTGETIGVNISKVSLKRVSIPRLAQGAVIPANREFLAVLGDQKQGVNIEAPLDTIVEAFNIALSQNGGTSGSNTIVLEVDGREFGRAVIEQGNKENRRIGTRLVTV